MPVLARVWIEGTDDEMTADKAALHEQGALPVLRRLAVGEHPDPVLCLHALLRCEHLGVQE